MSKNPTPHFEKLTAALQNEKLPARDKPRIEAAVERYHLWLKDLDSAYKLGEPAKVLKKLIQLLNEYKLYVDVDLIFNSEDDFLYRQKGQLKLDNSIIEEFLPFLIHPSLVPEVSSVQISVGPTTTFSSVYFTSSLDSPKSGAGMNRLERPPVQRKVAGSNPAIIAMTSWING